MRIELPSGTPAELAVADDSAHVLVITPDIFGLRELYDDMAARFATEWGVTTIVVEPFPGQDLGPEVEPRFAAVPGLDDDRHLSDLEAAADAAIAAAAIDPERARVGLMGFCMGGMYCFKAARSDRFGRIASFYGMIRLPEDWTGPGHREPLDVLADGHADRVLAIIGEQDHYTPAPDVDALEATGATVVRYPEAEHGFAHAPERPAHRPADAADAFARSRVWLFS